MEIRAATLGDYPDIAELGVEMGIQHNQAAPKLVTPDSMSEKAFSDLLADPNIVVVVGVEAGEFVGFLYYKIVDQPGDECFYAQRYLYIHEIGIIAKVTARR